MKRATGLVLVVSALSSVSASVALSSAVDSPSLNSARPLTARALPRNLNVVERAEFPSTPSLNSARRGLDVVERAESPSISRRKEEKEESSGPATNGEIGRLASMFASAALDAAPGSQPKSIQRREIVLRALARRKEKDGEDSGPATNGEIGRLAAMFAGQALTQAPGSAPISIQRRELALRALARRKEKDGEQAPGSKHISVQRRMTRRRLESGITKRCGRGRPARGATRRAFESLEELD
ncbi:hypothetical protein C8J56DRAFT_1158033 [Mycena floridula]|nr:hypothetical protein C8J56DRAFT_1158033 [Mycena floridula]